MKSMHGLENVVSFVGNALRGLFGSSNYGVIIWLLAFIFLWSGVVKLREPDFAARAIVDFGVLRRPNRVFGTVLGSAEILVALSLMACAIVGAYFRFSIIVATLLLWIFASLIARSLWFGKRFACFCFGDRTSLLSRWTLTRTTILALLGLGIVLAEPPLNTTNPEILRIALQALTALALLAIALLSTHLSNLLNWNRELLIGRTRPYDEATR